MLVQTGLKLKKKLVQCYIWIIVLYGADISTLRKIEYKYLESSEIWCWRNLQISWTEHVEDEEV